MNENVIIDPQLPKEGAVHIGQVRRPNDPGHPDNPNVKLLSDEIRDLKIQVAELRHRLESETGREPVKKTTKKVSKRN